ncbi:hypothetical protein [Nostoc sp. FACHB-190]|uniref:hypothetical protein n=1 Tax=Nostoc sp. FACHB-190 TaxID=2692838 RepID=UPI001687BC90|nr:hypothetical protein [Nostoc sp. FACHB-190]MBD2302268.1 hypothetical protein [Nostoc sp. FACHB-190]
MKVLIIWLLRILPDELVEEINAVSLDELVEERQRAEGRGQKEQLVVGLNPPLIKDNQIVRAAFRREDLVRVLNPDGQGKKAILKLNFSLLPPAFCLVRLFGQRSKHE